jgi:uncharacterized protein (TIGR00725 family)
VGRRRVVGVLGSGREEHRELAVPLGRWLAGAGVHLLTGAGGGVMGAVSESFAAVSPRAGAVIGIVPGLADARGHEAPSGYPNPWTEIAIFTHLPLRGSRGTEPLSRNHVNVLSSDVLVALPGGAGTASEIALALRYGKPIVAWVAGAATTPDLPAEVPRRQDLEGVTAFIRAHLV